MNRLVTDKSQVPDFRSANGLFNTLRSDNKLKTSGKHLFDASVYQTNESTSSFHDLVRTLSQLVSDARPTAFHEMLATLANEGRLLRLYTQNVDGIDTSLPPLETKVPLERKGPWPRTIQLHGSLEKMVCTKCNTLSPFDPKLFSGPVPPSCAHCAVTDQVRTEVAGKRSHGIGKLRPRMVLYNEQNPDDEAIGFVVKADLGARPDAVIVVGTSMEIPGVKRMVREMCGVVRGRRDGVAIWINRGPPPVGKEFEDCWDLVVAGDCDKVALRANMRRWNDEGNDYKDCTESEAERAKEREGDIKVVVRKTKLKENSITLGRSTTPKKSATPIMLTPAESPKSKAIIPKHFPFPPLQLSDPNGRVTTKGRSKGSISKTIPKTTSKHRSRQPTASATSKPTGNAKIKFKVIKSCQPPITKEKSPTPTNLSRSPPKEKGSKDSKPHPSPTGPEKAKKLLAGLVEEEPILMAPVLPLSARNNSLARSSTSHCPVLKVAKVEVPLKLEMPLKVETTKDARRLKRLGEERISPTGIPPCSMAALLN